MKFCSGKKEKTDYRLYEFNLYFYTRITKI